MTKTRIQALAAEAVARGKALGHAVALRLSEAEFTRLRTAASKHGLRAATFARILILAGLDEVEGGAHRGSK